MYAVIDVETTGLRTNWHDRIVEIAVVQLDAAGRVEREWCSLVNPGRDLGPQHIHGITAAEARRAPTFEQVAGRVVTLLRGRVCVAHNVAFDAAFLSAEYARLGVEVPLGRQTALCTMYLAGQFLPAAGRGLVDCCQVAGITLDRAHSALHDGRAAASLLAHYLAVAGTPPPWRQLLVRSTAQPWPPLDVSDVPPMARMREGQRQEHFLSRLVDQMPRLHNPVADAYLDILDRALLDRHISATEADALVAAADSLDLGRTDVLGLHEHYLQALAAIAFADGTLTAEERDDLDHVAVLLGLRPDHVEHVLRLARHAAGATEPSSTGPRRFAHGAGDIVVFTGQMDDPREVWAARAAAAGLSVGDRVTRNTRLLVAADPDSMSGKAKQANRYGIPIVHPAAFLRLVDTQALSVSGR
jgi:DNA polymerase-3 subunit epsilon